MLLTLLFIYFAQAQAPTATSAPAPTSTQSPTNDHFLDGLKKTNYSKTRTCRDVASDLLVRLGLPSLSERGAMTTAVKGQRASFDRGGADQNPPVFRDGLRAGQVDIKISAETSPWRLRLERRAKDIAAMTLIEFESKGDCEMQRLQFGSAEKIKMPHLHLDEVSVDTCMTALTMKPLPYAAAELARSWLKDDCKFALQYWRAHHQQE